MFVPIDTRLQGVTSEEIKFRGHQPSKCEKVIQEEGLDTLDNAGTGAA